MDTVRSIDRHASADEAMAILEEDGAVIYRQVVDDEVVDRVNAELEPFLSRAYYGEGEFWGNKTKRVSSLVAKSKSYGEELATCPQILGVMDRLLLPRCERYQLHVTQAVRIGPGQGLQIIHRDDALMPFRHPGPQCLCNTMWALTDFTIRERRHQRGSGKPCLGRRHLPRRRHAEGLCRHAARLVPDLSGLGLSRRWPEQYRGRVAHRRDYRLQPGMATPGGEPVSCGPSGRSAQTCAKTCNT